MMKHPLTITVLLLALSSCQDFLNIEPQDQISKEEALSTLDGVDAAVIGAYSTLGASDYYRQNFTVYPELAGNMQPNPAAAGSAGVADNQSFIITTYREGNFFTISPGYENNSFDEFYALLYDQLNRINNIIVALEAFETDQEARRNSLRGEALALRAIAHFDLLRLYAQPYSFTGDGSHPGVVLAERPFEITERPARRTVAEGYALVEADLLQAIELLGPSARRTTDRIWLTPSVARGLLARAYAYQGNWAGVIEQATAVINAGQVTLLNPEDYVDTWAEQQFNSEVLWYLDLQRFRNADAGSASLIASIARVIGTPSDTEFLPYCTVTQDLIGRFEEGDIRRELYQEVEGLLYCSKYALQPNSISNFPMLRLSEIYLLRAEAFAELGQDALAQADYNLIHQRAVEGAAPITLTGTELQDEIFEERRRELALEGHLLFDLKRTGRSVEREDCLLANPNCDLAYPDYRFALPIPQSALNANPNLIQNPGY
jgi:hypothetical protein